VDISCSAAPHRLANRQRAIVRASRLASRSSMDSNSLPLRFLLSLSLFLSPPVARSGSALLSSPLSLFLVLVFFFEFPFVSSSAMSSNLGSNSISSVDSSSLSSSSSSSSSFSSSSFSPCPSSLPALEYHPGAESIAVGKSIPLDHLGRTPILFPHKTIDQTNGHKLTKIITTSNWNSNSNWNGMEQAKQIKS